MTDAPSGPVEPLGNIATPALTLDRVSHAHAARLVLSDVSLSVPQGRFVALLGVDGAGKSTLFNLITRLLDARSGAISICGHPIRTEARAGLARTGVVFQTRSLDVSLTVAQNFRYQGALHGMRRAEVKPRMAALLSRIGLADRAHERVGTLSEGEVRRVEIVCALLHGPSLLLCDEATLGLDGKSRSAIVADVHKLAEDQRVGVLWTTHLTDEIWPDDPVVVLHEGRVLARGTARELAGEQSLSEAFGSMIQGDPGAPA